MNVGHARRRHLSTGGGEDALDRGDDEWIDGRGVRGVARGAAERTAAVHQGARDARPLARGRRDGHRLVDRVGELDHAEDEDEEQRNEERELGGGLSAFVAPHSVGSSRTAVLRWNVIEPAMNFPNVVTHWCV